MANTPTFSIVIPVYNGEKYIYAAIESCLQQTVLPDEIIVIDDASTDKTAEIILSIRSDLVVYIKNDQNKGVSFSRNKGIKMAKHSWVMLLDADDIFYPEKISIIKQCIETDHSFRAIGHGFDVQNDKEHIPEKWNEDILLKPVKVKDVLLRNPMVTPSLTVSADNRILFNEEMIQAEDHDFILRSTEKFPVVYLDMALCSLNRMPLTKGGLSSNKWKMRVGEMRMYTDYCKRKKWHPVIPFFLLFSLLKHLKQLVGA